MSDPKNRIRRILNIIPYVRRHQGVPIEELARYCGATPAEVLADLDSILLCGVPPYLPDDYIGVYVDGGRVEIRFADHFRRPVRFTPVEALAMLLAVESLPEGGDEEHREARDSLTAKIRAILADTMADGEGPGIPRVDGRIETVSGSGPSVGVPPARRTYLAALAVLKPAVEARQEVEIEYYSASKDETRSRVVRPYGFVEKDGDLYLVAHCKAAKGVRSFRVDRIRRARALEGTRFEPPKGFQIERYAKNKMNFSRDLAHARAARVLVRDRRIVRWLRETRAGDLEETPTGDVIVTLRAFELPWLVNEVLSWGPDVEVLSPPEVREAMRQHTHAMAERARGGAAACGSSVAAPAACAAPAPDPQPGVEPAPADEAGDGGARSPALEMTEVIDRAVPGPREDRGGAS